VYVCPNWTPAIATLSSPISECKTVKCARFLKRFSNDEANSEAAGTYYLEDTFNEVFSSVIKSTHMSEYIVPVNITNANPNVILIDSSDIETRFDEIDERST
jgi:hypothetical protein